MPDVATAPGDRLIRAGVVTSVAGMVMALVSLLPLVTDLELPSLFWALSMLTGIGFALILIGLARKGRRRARAQVTVRTAAD
jgi:formate-dependent nitrite reductase membrane component NrfD